MDNNYFKYVSAYDVGMMYIFYKQTYHRIKHNYEEKIKKMIENNNFVRINYTPKNEIIVSMTAPYSDYADEIIFYKENSRLLFHINRSVDNKTVLQISKIIPEIFDSFSESEYIFKEIKEKISDINSVNSDFKLRITDETVETYKKDYKIILKLFGYNYNTNSINTDYLVDTKYVDILNEVQGNEKKILKKISFNINDFPNFFAENLIKYKKSQIIDKTPNQEGKKENSLKKFLSLFK